ncbi:HNH endonuclease [Candidatus Poribacteria bacterium]|nr:HNH endonuclease [Candidatus Poribacteria bacterium]
MRDKLYRKVAKRARHKCEYCHAPEAPCGYKFHVEHIIPRSKEGSDDLSNLALCCAPCNLHKSNNIEKGTVRFFHPRQDSWEAHFTWNDDYTIVIGKTKMGQITIEALQMNSPRAIQARKSWILSGDHP